VNIIVGTPKDIQPLDFHDDKVFVSQPYYKIILENGLGFYILNSYKFSPLPKFYGEVKKNFWEFGFFFAGWVFEVMWNRSFIVNERN